MEELIHIDNLCNRCGFFTSNTPINGGYGCNHKECDDGEYVCNGEVIDYYKARVIIAKGLTRRNIKCNRRLAKKFIKKARASLDRNINLSGVKFQGACRASVCPLGSLAEEEDFVRFGEDPDCMAEGEWVIINSKQVRKELNDTRKFILRNRRFRIGRRMDGMGNGLLLRGR